VEASVALIAERWRPAPSPTWVTAVPSAGSAAGSSAGSAAPESSAGRGALVGDFAARLAAALGLPYVDCLTTLEGALPQADMQNSVQQASNARSKLGVRGALVRSGPVLLVDDIVDSRWTMTVATSLLREHGAGEVFPFALALAAGRGG
jgi:ATP-dependent DNA helicase RecQ